MNPNDVIGLILLALMERLGTTEATFTRKELVELQGRVDIGVSPEDGELRLMVTKPEPKPLIQVVQ